jgi:hypothetical protein
MFIQKQEQIYNLLGQKIYILVRKKGNSLIQELLRSVMPILLCPIIIPTVFRQLYHADSVTPTVLIYTLWLYVD